MPENNNSSTSEVVKATVNESATVIVKRRIKPEQVDAFKSAIDEVTKAVRSFPGFLEVGVLRPAKIAGDKDSEWGIILHFDSEANLKNCESLPERKRWVTLADSFITGAPQVERVNGLEG